MLRHYSTSSGFMTGFFLARLLTPTEVKSPESHKKICLSLFRMLKLRDTNPAEFEKQLEYNTRICAPVILEALNDEMKDCDDSIKWLFLADPSERVRRTELKKSLSEEIEYYSNISSN